MGSFIRHLARVTLLAGSAACIGGRWDEQCEEACGHYYGADDCNVAIPGYPDAGELVERCTEECLALYGVAGELGSYDPATEPDVGRELANQAEAEAWMACVTAATCEELNDGACLPAAW